MKRKETSEALLTGSILIALFGWCTIFRGWWEITIILLMIADILFMVAVFIRRKE